MSGRLALPTGQQLDNKKDGDGDYQEYPGRTELGRRGTIIIELYGAITPYTEYRYWWVDSIERQTIALMDKPGLRRKGTIPPDPDKKIKHLDDKQVKNVLASLGIGTDAPAEEDEDQKAERIRNELNTK